MVLLVAHNLFDEMPIIPITGKMRLNLTGSVDLTSLHQNLTSSLCNGIHKTSRIMRLSSMLCICTTHKQIYINCLFYSLLMLVIIHAFSCQQEDFNDCLLLAGFGFALV